ncbi:uncharacterized protein EDB93DRAFT_1108727 [Suillus bovinus]|uniref:uncharacterized protein n=1 Tax=Suillus bovinus TaxID=48563 RepID=UPI001B86A7A2|nr:uncharacterized protein EDB93DRAFT_1108727 [Suillus bovinus]KAG2129259.1 hypothetical protein EDB93DRAFT_1108727 [Suillus bovinus]
MDEDDSLELLQQILKLNILDVDPHGSSTSATGRDTAESPSRNLSNNNGSDNCGALSAAIDACDIAEGWNDEVETKKPKRGRPRKRVVNSRKKQHPSLPCDEPTQNILKITNDKRLIRATISPVPENLTNQHNTIDYGIICSDDQQGQRAEDELSDTADILQQIMRSGILDWNPKGSLSVTHAADASSNRAEERRDRSQDIESTLISHQNNRTKGNELRRPCGRPVRRAKAQQKKYNHVALRDRLSSPKERRNNHSGFVIRATSNPVQEGQQEKGDIVQTDHIAWPDEALCSGNGNNDGPYIEGNPSRTCLSNSQRRRGRPKKRIVHARGRGSKHQVMRKSPSSAAQSKIIDNDYTHETGTWSPAPSIAKIHDDEYRPSPPPHAILRSPSLEVSQNNITVELTVQEVASRAMARPVIWTSAWYNWTTLGLNEWLDATVANYYLCDVWYEVLGRSQMRYVDLYAAMVNDMVDEELELFRKYHFLSQDGTCPVVPVGFIVHHSDHFFAVVFDYQRHIAHVMGRHISDSMMDVDGVDPNDWEDWDGPQYWRRIGSLHRWSTGDVTNVSVRSTNWLQNGVDCGPIACSVLEECLRVGLDDRGDLPAIDIICGHKLRIHMLRVVAGRLKLSCSDYLMLLDGPLENWREDDVPDEDVMNSIRNGQHQAECLKLLRKLTVVSATCSMCQRQTPQKDRENPSAYEDENRDGLTVDEDGVEAESTHEDDSLGMALSVNHKENLTKLLKANKHLTGSRNRNLIVPRATGTHLQLEPDIPLDEPPHHLVGE